METGRIIIVDDEPILLKAICDTLGGQGFETTGHTSAMKALDTIRTQKFDLLLSDLNMPEIDGITLLQKASEIDSDLVGIIMTGQATVDSAVEAMKQGALDYILKPFRLKTILPVLSRAISVRKLRMRNAELTEHLKYRTAELEAMNKDLEAFSSSVSHDLRAPINFIRNFAEMIRGEAQLTPRQHKFLAGISGNAEYMEELIESLLKFARSGRNELEKSQVDMEGLVTEVIDQLLPSGHHYQIKRSKLPNAYCDETLFYQVFTNLISNSIKYASKKESPQMEIGSEIGKDELIFYVGDNGDGFHEKDAAGLFEPFKRLHSEADFEGTGVGLAIVKRIVSRHGGNVWARGKKGEGATFYFSLPNNRSAARLS